MKIKQLHEEIENQIKEAIEYLKYWNNMTEEEKERMKVTDRDISDNIQWWNARLVTLEDIRMEIEDCEEYNED